LSLNLKGVLPFTVISFVFTVAFTVIFYFIQKNMVLKQIDGKLKTAALFMSTTITLFRTFAHVCKLPSEILFKMNNEIFVFNETMSFVTIICGIYHLKTGEVVYSNAGHTVTYLLKDEGGIEKISLSTGIVAGIFKDYSFGDFLLQLLPKHAMVFFTDGITKAFNVKNETHGVKGLENFLKNLQYKTVKVW
jgi:sigma-B regulation protein RsbU (phosphoserine phosphatase)